MFALHVGPEKVVRHEEAETYCNRKVVRHEEAETYCNRNRPDHIISQSVSEENHGGLDDPRPLHGHGHRHPLGGGGVGERRR